MDDISGEYFENFAMYDISKSATKMVKKMYSDNESETNQTDSYLEIELKRLTVEERAKRDQYNDSKMELQEVWNKVVGLQTYIHGLRSEIENAKIECITSCPSHSRQGEEDGSRNLLTTESASRLADIQILKEKIRTKEGLRTRSAVLTDELASSRRQLSQLTDSLNKSVAHDSAKGSTTVANALIPYTHHGSIASSMNLRNLLIETARSIDQLEDDLTRTNAEHDLLERELNAALNSDAYSDIFHTDGQDTNSGGGGSSDNRLRTPMKLLGSNINGNNRGHSEHNSTNKAKLTPAQQRQTPGHKLDASVLDIITHGAPLSDDLVAALTSGSAFNHSSTAQQNEDRQRQVVEGEEVQCELTLAEILSGTAANVTRMNGEEPAAYLVRLQRRLSGLGVLEAQVQSEFETKVAEVKELRDKLQDVELKRLRVELQVSNMRAGQAKHQTSNSSSKKKKDRSTDYYEILKQDKQRQQVKKASGSVPTQSNPLVDSRNARVAAAATVVESPTKYTADDSGNAVRRGNHRRTGRDDDDDDDGDGDGDSSQEDTDDHSDDLNTSAVVDFEDIYRSRSQSQSQGESRGGGQQQSPSKRATAHRGGDVPETPLSPVFNPLASNEAVSRYSKRAGRGSVPAIAVDAEFGGNSILKPKQRRESTGKSQAQSQEQSPRRRPSVDEMLQGHISESTFESMTMAKQHRERQQQRQQQYAAARSGQNAPPSLSPPRKGTDNINKRSNAGKRSPRGGRRLSGGGKTSPSRSPSKSINNKSTSLSSSLHYEASILEQLLKHSQMLGDQTDPRSIDHNFLVQQHDEVNRLILLYLASSESSSALSTQLKVKVLSKLLSRDLTSGDVRELIDFSRHGGTSGHGRGGGVRGDEGGVDSESVGAGGGRNRGDGGGRDSDDFRHVPQELYPHSHSQRQSKPDQSQSQHWEQNWQYNSRQDKPPKDGPSSREKKPFTEHMEGSLFGNVRDKDNSSGGQRSPERRDRTQSRDAHYDSERTPSRSPDRKGRESDFEHTPVSSAEMVQTRNNEANYRRESDKSRRGGGYNDNSDRNEEVDGVDDDDDDGNDDAIEVYDETHVSDGPASTALETASQTAVVMIPPKKPWLKDDNRAPDTSGVNSSTKSRALVTSTATSSASQCLNRGSLAILTSPCSCKYCQPDNYEYRTMYDRNGRYIGPPELRPSGGTGGGSGSGSGSNSASHPPSTSMGTNTDSLSRPGSAGSGRRDVYLHSYFSPAETDQMILRRRSEGIRSAEGNSSSHNSSFSVFGSTKRSHRRSQSVGALDRRRSTTSTAVADTSTIEDGRVLFPLSPTHKPTFSSQLHSRVASPYFDDKNEFDRKHILQSVNKEHITVSSGGGGADKRRHSFSGTPSSTIQRLRPGSTVRNSTGNQSGGRGEKTADETDTGDDTRYTAEERQAHRAHSTSSTTLTRSTHGSTLSAEDSLSSTFIVGKPYIGCRLCSRVKRNRASEGGAQTSAILNDDGEVEGIATQQSSQASSQPPQITSSFGRTDKKTISPIKRKPALTSNSTSNNSKMINSVDGKRRQVPATTDSQDGLSDMLAALTADDDGTGDDVIGGRNVDLLVESLHEDGRGVMEKKSSFVFAEDILTTPVLPLRPSSFRSSRSGSKDHTGGVDATNNNNKSTQQVQGRQQQQQQQNPEEVPPDAAESRLNEGYQAFLYLLKQSNISHETLLSAIDQRNGGETASTTTTRSRSGSHASVSGLRSSTAAQSSSASSSTDLLSNTVSNHRQSVNAVVQRLQEMADELEQSQVNVRRDLLASMDDGIGGGDDGDEYQYQQPSPARVRQSMQNAVSEEKDAELDTPLNQEMPPVAEQDTGTTAEDDGKAVSVATMDSLSAALRKIETHHQCVKDSIRSTGSDILNSSMQSQGGQSQSGGFNPNVSLRSHASTLLGASGVQSIRSGYLQHTLDRQQREIDELRRTQRALEVLLQSDAQISQLRSSQQILMALLEGSNTSDDYKHLLKSTDVLVGNIAALGHSVSRQSLRSNLAADNDHNSSVIPQSLLKSPAYVRARSRSNSRGSEDDMAENYTGGKSGSRSNSYTDIHSGSRIHSADKRAGRSADKHAHHQGGDDDEEVAAAFRDGGGYGEEQEEDYGGYNNSPNRRQTNSQQQQQQQQQGYSNIGGSNNTFSNNIRTVPADHPTAQHYLSPAVYDEMVHFLTQRLSLCGSKYAQFASQETVDPDTGIAHNPDGSSKGYIDITLIAARNLPEMKRLHKSADAYAELTLVTVGPNTYSSDNARHDLFKFSPPELLSIISTAQGSGMDMGSHINSRYGSPPSSPRNYRHYDQSPQRRSRSGSGSAEAYHAITDGFQRTTVKAETLFPEWREHFRFPGLRSLTSQAVLVTLRDSSRVGHQINIKDAGIGQLVLPLSMPLLRNQSTHSMWVDLQPMPTPKLSASDYTRRVPVVKLPSNCAVKVELKLFYSHTRYWQDQRTESQDLLDSLNTLYRDYTRHLEGGGRQQQAVTHNIYARDKAVLDRIHTLMVKHGFRKSAPMSNHGGSGGGSDSRMNTNNTNNAGSTAGMTQRESKIRRYVIVGLREQQRNAPAFSPRSASKSKQNMSPQNTRRYQQPQQYQSQTQTQWAQGQNSTAKRQNAYAFNQQYQPQYQQQQEPRSASNGGRSSQSSSPLKSAPKKPRVSTTPATAGMNRSQQQQSQQEQQVQMPFSTENTPTTAPTTVELVEPDTQRTTSDSIEENEEVRDMEEQQQQQQLHSSPVRPNTETVTVTSASNANSKTHSNGSEGGGGRVDLSIFKGSRGGRSAYDHYVNSSNIQQAKAARAGGRTQYAFSSTEKR